ncbi:MAG: AI-2E family transporter [Actinomycetota bacterium]|nr:AI-2E family transporter [Actinomycetota bacterium]
MTAAPSNAEVRAWARSNGLDVPARGRVPAAMVEAYLARAEADDGSDGPHLGEVAEQLHQEAEALIAVSADHDLVEGEVRDLVAGVDEENPFGRRGRPFAEHSPLRLGFTVTLGGLLALELGRAVLATRAVLVLLLVSAFLAIGLDPAVTWLERRVRRGAAVTLVLTAFLALFGGFVVAAIPPLTTQVAGLVAHGPQYVDEMARNSTVRSLDRHFHFLAGARREAGRLPDTGVKAVGGVLGAGAAVLGALASLVTLVTLTVYLLANMPSIKRYCYLLVPRTRRARVSLLSDEILARVGGYVLGNLATSVVAGGTALVFMLVTGMPYAVTLALLIAITDLIPLVGATIGAAIVVLVAFLSQGVGVGLASIVFFTIYQQFENFVLVPRVMKRTVDVSPLVTILAALIGAALLGIVGALMAIPVAAAIQLVVREVLLPRQNEA